MNKISTKLNNSSHLFLRPIFLNDDNDSAMLYITTAFVDREGGIDSVPITSLSVNVSTCLDKELTISQDYINNIINNWEERKTSVVMENKTHIIAVLNIINDIYEEYNPDYVWGFESNDLNILRHIYEEVQGTSVPWSTIQEKSMSSFIEIINNSDLLPEEELLLSMKQLSDELYV